MKRASDGYDWRYGCEGERGGSRCGKKEGEGLVMNINGLGLTTTQYTGSDHGLCR